ncbi:unnamed protein product [Closterium sp. Yama58-4]|nr:unnamed protein product [Closterium sp. Yama58-4]
MVSSIQATTGAPWWLTLIGSTLALRLALFPLTWHQMSISSQLAELGPKLPPPFPLPGSGMTWQQAWALRQRRRKQLNAPSALWLLAAPTVQIPLFFTWIFTMRHMALSAHPGFDVGGCLWFEDLTAFPHGVLGWVLPLSIAASFYSSVQVLSLPPPLPPSPTSSHSFTSLCWLGASPLHRCFFLLLSAGALSSTSLDPHHPPPLLRLPMLGWADHLPSSP